MIKNLKGIIACILTVCMCLLLQMNSINVDAAETASISIGSASGNVGDTVTVICKSASKEEAFIDFEIKKEEVNNEEKETKDVG